jgi:small basic protein
MASKHSLRRGVLVLAAPAVVYAVVRPAVSSDALGLAIAAAVPVIYGIVLALARRRVDPLAGLSAVGFSVACVISVVTGGSSLPLKLHEAFITFGIGLVLVVATLIGRPPPMGRLLRMPASDPQLDRPLGAVVGGFLVLHALLHFALAASLSTSAYLVAGRAVSWGTLALGALALAAFRRRAGR